MTSAVCIYPSGRVEGSIRPPGSKSLTNRALVLAALARGRTTLSGVLDSEDTHVMIEAWRRLGIAIEHDVANKVVKMTGCGGALPNTTADLFIANSGTTIRFLTAALAACRGVFTLDGIERMRQRPIGDLIVALNRLGANVTSLNAERPDCPPVRVEANGFQRQTARVAGNISSQYLSGLMMAAAMADQTIRLEVEGELVSVPYVEMTAKVMTAFGANVKGPVGGPIEIEPTGYEGCEYEIEPDASAASYFWAAAAITRGDVRVDGLSKHSLQGDVRFCEVLEEMGCELFATPDSLRIVGGDLRGVDVDMSDISDTVQTLAAVALFARGPTRVRGVAHNRHKETDRIADLARELRKFGARVVEFPDGLEIFPPPRELLEPELLDPTLLEPESNKPRAGQASKSPCVEPGRWINIETYNDHRMAMSLSLVGLRSPGVRILNPGCTAKTYPEFWTDLARLTQARLVNVEA